MTAVISVCIFKKIITIGEFLCSHFNIKIEENMQHFWYIMLHYFKKGKNATEMQKRKRFVQYLEKVMRLIKLVKGGLRSFMLEISHWTKLHGQVGKLKLTVIKSRH